MKRTLLRSSLLAVVLLAFSPSIGHAHPGEQSFRLGLGIPAVAVTHFPGDAGPGGVPGRTIITYGLYPVTFGVHLGWQIASSIGLAVHVMGGGIYTNTGGTSVDIVYFSAAPRFEYMFTPHGTVAPYLGVEVGIDVFGPTNTNLSDIFRTGGFFGLHIFADTVFSVDLELAANFVYDLDTGRAGVRGVFYLSVTGWLA